MVRLYESSDEFHGHSRLHLNKDKNNFLPRSSSYSCIWVYDSSLSIQLVNKAFLKMIGFEMAEISSLNLSKISTDDELVDDQNVYDAILLDNMDIHVRRRNFIALNGKVVHTETISYCMGCDNNEQLLVYNVSEDITSRFEMIDNLKTVQRQRFDFVDFFADPTIIVNKSAEIVFWNSAMADLLNIPSHKIVGHPVGELSEILFGKREKLLVEIALDSGDSEVSNSLGRGDLSVDRAVRVKGNKLILMGKAKPFFDANGQVAGAIESFRDITERSLMEEKVLTAIFDTEEQERRNFAQNIHDSLGALLTTTKIYLNIALEEISGEGEVLVKKAIAVLDEAIHVSRDVSSNLYPHNLSNLGLFAMVQSLMSKVKETGIIDISLIGFIPAGILTQNQETNLYRIIKELINNTLKHSSATSVNLSMAVNASTLVIRYQDNGLGIAEVGSSLINRGNGLQNIRRRGEAINASITIESNTGGGFSFMLTLPIS